MSARVAVVVLTWDDRELTLRCLGSLGALTYPDVRVVLVDNGSRDGTVDAVARRIPDVRARRAAREPRLRRRRQRRRRGGARGGAEHVFLLNNDATVEPGALEPLVGAAAAASVGAACSQILHEGSGTIWYAGAEYDPRRGHQGRHTGYGRPALPPETAPYPTGRACGGAMLVPRAALDRVGLLDDALFAYAEDVDWSVRAQRAGLSILVVPASVVHHRVSAASGGASSPTSVYYALRNGLVVAERYAPLGRLGTLRRRAAAGGGVLRPGAPVRLAARAGSARSSTGSATRRAAGSGRGERDRGLRPPGSGSLAAAPRPPLGRPAARPARAAARCAARKAARSARAGCSRPSWRGAGGRASRSARACSASTAARACASGGSPRCSSSSTRSGRRRSRSSSARTRFRALRIAEINSIGRMHPVLAEAPGLVHVEYPEEDIQALSWADGSFDLVLTSETLEHVPDPALALRETLRVLRPGGRHVFTVPLDPALEATRSRAGLPAEHHGRGGGPFALVTRKADMVVHTDFGPDLGTSCAPRASTYEARGDGHRASSRSRPGRWRRERGPHGARHGRRRAGRLAPRPAPARARATRWPGIVRREPAAYAEALAHARAARSSSSQADLLDRASLVAALRETRPAEVYNLASPSFVPRSWDEPVLTAEFAAVGATSLLEAIREVDPAIRFYQASSSEIFGEPRETPQTEATRAEPADAVRRREGVRALHRAQLPPPLRHVHAAAGSSTTTSRRSGRSTSSRARSSRAAAAISLGLEHELVLGDLSARRDWGYAGDYVRAMWLMLQHDEPGDYVVATGRLALASRSSSPARSTRSGSTGATTCGPTRRCFRGRAELHDLVGDATKARETLGWRAGGRLRRARRAARRRRPRAASGGSGASSRRPRSCARAVASQVKRRRARDPAPRSARRRARAPPRPPAAIASGRAGRRGRPRRRRPRAASRRPRPRPGSRTPSPRAAAARSPRRGSGRRARRRGGRGRREPRPRTSPRASTPVGQRRRVVPGPRQHEPAARGAPRLSRANAANSAAWFLCGQGRAG